MTNYVVPLNIFYQEPDPDRWFKFDRFPRKIIRKLYRGKQRPSGVMMVALELMRGLDKIGVSYRFNDFKYADQHPNELVCLIGKPHLLFNRKWKNPILFGPGIYSHPIDCLNLFIKYPNVKNILVPSNWIKKMFEPYYGDKVLAWPVGIDTEKWHPDIKKDPLTIDFLIYNKILWDQELKSKTILDPIIQELKNRNCSFEIIKYGKYTHQELITKLSLSKAVIFLCEHETQGLAYQQILATNTPILAWDQQGYWIDPSYFPDKVKFGPVSSVPYWDERCGMKFKDLNDFNSILSEFLTALNSCVYSPREYILENLTLEKCAEKYLEIVKSIS